MSLPVPYDYPIVPVIQCDMHSPPNVPVVEGIPDHIKHIQHLVAGAVINEACIKANNSSLRMFCYNLLVNNYWTNPYFAQVVKEVLLLIALNLKKGKYRTPEQGIQESVFEILTYFTGGLIYDFPDLRSVCDENTQKAAFENAVTYNNLKNEMMTMHNTQQPYPQQGYPQQGYPQHPQFPGQQFPQQPQFLGQQFPQQPQFPGQQFPQQGQFPGQQFPLQHPGMYPQQPQFPGQQFQQPAQPTPWVQPSNVFGQANPTAPNVVSTENIIKQDRFMTRTAVKTEPVVTFVQQQPQPVIEEKVMEHTYLTIQEGSEMERSKHQIGYFGDSYHTDTVIKNEKFSKAAVVIASPIPIDINDAGDQVYPIAPVWLAECCLDAAVTRGRLKFLQGKDAIMKVRATVANPIVTLSDFNSYAKLLREATTFSNLSTKFKSLAMSFEIKKDEQPLVDGTITVMSAIDRMLTAEVNTFLHHNLKLQTTLDSIIEDGEELADFILRTYGATYHTAFLKFEDTILESVFAELNAESEFAISKDLQLPEDVYYATVRLNYSLIFLNMNDKELGYNVGSNSVIIDREVAPSLYSIAKSEARDKRELKLPYLASVVVTADGARYRLFENYLNPAEFLIARL